MTRHHQIMTVRGPIDAAELGFTLMHEHLYYRFWDVPARFDAMPTIASGDLDHVLPQELTVFKKEGGSALVEMTLPGIWRQPERMRELSEKTDVHIIMGCGWYREPYYPPRDDIDRRSVDDLARQLVDEISNGVGKTGIRPGIIGEIGTHNSWISALEERVHRAAARAAQLTGLTVTTHSAGCDVGLAQLAIFQEEGLPFEQIIVGHADTFLQRDYHEAVLSTGAFLQFDMVGMYGVRFTECLADSVAGLIEAGYADQLLLSHDICRMEHLKYFGGQGFTFIQEHFLPMLRKRGISDDAVGKITTANPRRALSGRPATRQTRDNIQAATVSAFRR